MNIYLFLSNTNSIIALARRFLKLSFNISKAQYLVVLFYFNNPLVDPANSASNSSEIVGFEPSAHSSVVMLLLP